ncbi:hypothetical protein [Chitinophaga sp. Cy-1792]|uniref:hypothetical protein n=1 Tax=Chitinophaga sp. Cy-1792 TaxID=2608339 RepID=UPI0014216121|nr:hypothetical protein [Chitinophaga sp. Cy-1792]NIG55386.1 hypothetical protein [Chitinophaga sp. Cy-1792]
MTASKFIEELKSQIPSNDILVKKKISASTVERSIDPVKNLNTQSGIVLTGNVVIELLSKYDLSKVEIGMVGFSKAVTEDESFYYIGSVEVDLLVINKYSGIIQVLEYDQPKHTLWDCAHNCPAFLEALLICKGYFWECLLDDVVYNDDVRRSATVEQCAYIAGGEAYYDFYAMLLGL